MVLNLIPKCATSSLKSNPILSYPAPAWLGEGHVIGFSKQEC